MSRYVFALSFVMALAGCAIFGASQQAQVAQDGATIFTCQTKGREAGSYKAYDDCMQEAGLHTDGSSK